MLELARGGRRDVDGTSIGVIDLTRVPGLAEIVDDGAWLHLGPLVTHNQCAVSPAVVAHALPLARASWEVGAPQIRNRATVAGNVITASPANDTIVPLLALDATVTVASAARGERTLPLAAFITGFRTVDLAVDEMLVRISVPKLGPEAAGTFIKLGLRQAQAISVLDAWPSWWCGTVRRSPTPGIAMGAVAPTVVRAAEAEELLRGRSLDDATIRQAAALAVDAATPIDDLRGSAAYRKQMVNVLVARALRAIEQDATRAGWQARPVTLQGHTDGRWPVGGRDAAGAPSGKTPFPEDPLPGRGSGDAATVNGRPIALPGKMTLLDSLRAAGYHRRQGGLRRGRVRRLHRLSGRHGRDGVHGARGTGLRQRGCDGGGVRAEGHLHPVQQALVETGGVQCGFCTPGFVMSGAKLLEERPSRPYMKCRRRSPAISVAAPAIARFWRPWCWPANVGRRRGMTVKPELPLVVPVNWRQKLWYWLLRLIGWSVRGVTPSDAEICRCRRAPYILLGPTHSLCGQPRARSALSQLGGQAFGFP